MFEHSLQIGRISGIELRFHWTMLLGILYYYWSIRPADREELLCGRGRIRRFEARTKPVRR